MTSSMKMHWPAVGATNPAFPASRNRCRAAGVSSAGAVGTSHTAASLHRRVMRARQGASIAALHSLLQHRRGGVLLTGRPPLPRWMGRVEAQIMTVYGIMAAAGTTIGGGNLIAQTAIDLTEAAMLTGRRSSQTRLGEGSGIGSRYCKACLPLYSNQSMLPKV